MSFVSGDTGSVLQVTCRDNDSNDVIDLTGSTVRLKWMDAASDLQTRTMTISNPTGGVVTYQFQSGELFAKQMKFEVEVTDSGGSVLHSLSLLREDVRGALS